MVKSQNGVDVSAGVTAYTHSSLTKATISAVILCSVREIPAANLNHIFYTLLYLSVCAGDV